MNKNWITEQSEKNVSHFEQSMEENNTGAVDFIRSPRAYYKRYVLSVIIWMQSRK